MNYENIEKIEVPEILRKMGGIFKSNGFEAFLVGGAVRDMILGKAASDWDLTTNARPEDVIRIFRKVIPTGIAHGTVTVHFMGKEIEVTTYRSDGKYSDGRHPDKVTFDATLEEDLSRRDFTINALAASLEDGKIVDLFEGKRDIKKKIIRTVGNAHDRFMEDGLRPIRAIRFSAQLDFEIEGETLKAIENPDVQEKIKSISIERFRDELIKILKSDVPSKALHLLEETGILKIFIPELCECRGCSQKDVRGFHEFDVLDHNFYACDGADKTNFTVRLAALFHDIGKKDARTVEKREWPEGSGNVVELIHFHKHEIYSAEQSEKILTRLRFPNNLIEKVVHLIRHHMFFFEENWSDAAVRRFIVRIGPENISDLFELRKADIYGMHREKWNPESESAKSIENLKKRISEIESQKTALSLKDLAVNGKDLIAAGIPAGKELGKILSSLFDLVLENPEMNKKDVLLEKAKKMKNGLADSTRIDTDI